MRPLLSSFLLFYVGVAHFGAWAAPLSILEEGSHCVAYRVEKTVFFFKKDKVVGKNCDVSAQVLPEVGGLYHIEVNIPVRGFTSGDSDRDRDVMNILRAKERPEITFKSKSLKIEEWQELLKKTTFPMEGELAIGVKSYPIQLTANYVDREDFGEIDGVGTAHFKDFDLKPPKIIGGIVTSVKPQLELHFHFNSQRVLGADTIRPTNNGVESQ